MAEIKPFNGYRFHYDTPEDLGRFIAPPYDMLDDTGIDALYRKDPFNIVRIDQNRPESTDTSNRSRHVRAAALFSDWTSRGVCRAEAQSSLYVYQQNFAIECAGVTESFERSGVVALVRLADFDDGIVLPHEYTLSGPKADRYEHLDATRCNVGQIFGLLSDDRGALYSLIHKMKLNATALGSALDSDGVRHTLYRCGDDALIAAFREETRPCSILIADGHHRYETALSFFHDHHDDPVFAYMMMTLVSMADPGLVIRSFHRIIKKQKTDRVADLTRELGSFFFLAPLGRADIVAVNSFLGGRIDAEMLYVDSATGGAYTLSLNENGERFLQTAASGHSALWNHLDVSKINTIVLGRILGLPLDGRVLHDVIEYKNDAAAALEASLDAARCHGGFFVRPLRIPVIRDIVKGGERMPQKSTNFFPKLYSGLVINKLG